MTETGEEKLVITIGEMHNECEARVEDDSSATIGYLSSEQPAPPGTRHVLR